MEEPKGVFSDFKTQLINTIINYDTFSINDFVVNYLKNTIEVYTWESNHLFPRKEYKRYMVVETYTGNVRCTLNQDQLERNFIPKTLNYLNRKNVKEIINPFSFKKGELNNFLNEVNERKSRNLIFAIRNYYLYYLCKKYGESLISGIKSFQRVEVKRKNTAWHTDLLKEYKLTPSHIINLNKLKSKSLKELFLFYKDIEDVFGIDSVDKFKDEAIKLIKKRYSLDIRSNWKKDIRVSIDIENLITISKSYDDFIKNFNNYKK
jgi:hypothetical protein